MTILRRTYISNLGLQKLGIVVAFINYHIRAKPLVHSINVSEAKALIVGPGMLLQDKQERTSLNMLNQYLAIFCLNFCLNQQFSGDRVFFKDLKLKYQYVSAKMHAFINYKVSLTHVTVKHFIFVSTNFRQTAKKGNFVST